MPRLHLQVKVPHAGFYLDRAWESELQMGLQHLQPLRCPREVRLPFLGGMAKAVQAIPAAVEGLVLGQPASTSGHQGARSSEIEGYVSAQSGSPERPLQSSARSPAPGTPLLDERTLRRLNEHPEAAPHLYQPGLPTSGLKPPSTTSSDIQNEVRRQLQELMAARDEETRSLRLQVEARLSENQMLQRDRAELSAQMYGRDYSERPGAQGFLQGLGWLGRGFGSIMSSSSSPKPPAPPRALDFRPTRPPSAPCPSGLGIGPATEDVPAIPRDPVAPGPAAPSPCSTQRPPMHSVPVEPVDHSAPPSGPASRVPRVLDFDSAAKSPAPSPAPVAFELTGSATGPCDPMNVDRNGPVARHGGRLSQ